MTARREADRLITLREIAARLGVSHLAARRRIVRLHKQHGGVVVRLSPSPRGKIMVSEQGLINCCPEFVRESVASRQDFAFLSTEVAAHRKRLNAQASAIRDLKTFQRKANEWLTRGPK